MIPSFLRSVYQHVSQLELAFPGKPTQVGRGAALRRSVLLLLSDVQLVLVVLMRSLQVLEVTG